MPLMFYPHSEDAQKGSFEDRIEILMDAAESYKAVILDKINKPELTDNNRVVPRDLTAAYNWEEIAVILREIRELSEANKTDKIRKGTLLARLAEIYEVLRAARMPKLEAVRLALINEANQLRGGASQQVA